MPRNTKGADKADPLPADQTEAIAAALLDPATASLAAVDPAVAAIDAALAVEDDDVDLPGAEPIQGLPLSPEDEDLTRRRNLKVGRGDASDVRYGIGRIPGTSDTAGNVVIRRGSRKS